MRSEKLLQKAIIAAVCVGLIVTGFPVDYLHAQNIPQENLAVIFIVDDSGSMAGYDPINLRYTAVKLMISSLDAGDKVGFIQFSTGSEIVTDGLVTLTSEETKAALINEIQLPTPDGYTDFLAALKDAQYLINTADDLSSHETIVVFLTDGYPYPAVGYAGYLDDVIDLSSELAVPIYAIALTPEGQSATLNQMAQVSGGKLIFANTAEDLLDSYLQLLGELKDRTVIKGEAAETGSQILFLDPALMTYVSKVSFVVAHPSDGQVRLVSPSGMEINETHPSVGFFMGDDPAFTVITLDTLQGGEWNLEYTGSGSPQARAILNSRLRANILAPENVFQAGKPITFVVNLIEELSDGTTRKVVGEADFSAEIELPDGTLQSLDRFYDDGTFGDLIAGDGNFSRQFVDTQQGGIYKVTINGRKDIVHVTTYRNLTAIEVPLSQLREPRLDFYEVSDEPIPIEFRFNADTFKEEFFEGSIFAKITDPQRNLQALHLSQEGNIFHFEYLPIEDGVYTIDIDFSEAYYLGVQIADEILKYLEVKLIPTLVVGSYYFGFDSQSQLGKFNIEDIDQGIPITINILSTSSEQESITISAEGVAGYSVLSAGPILIEPKSENKVVIILKSDSPVTAGTWSGSLTIRPSSNVNLSQSLLPINFSVIQPTMTFAIDEIVVEPQRILCFRTQPIQIILSAISTSDKEEVVTFAIDGINEVEIADARRYISPGNNPLVLSLFNTSTLTAGEYAVTLTFTSEDDSLLLQNELGGNDLRFNFLIDGFWQRCKVNIIISAGIIFLLFILFKLISRKIRHVTKKPLVVGTLIYWNKNAPDEQTNIDLNAMDSAEICVGSNPDCDIFINDISILQEHFKLISSKENRMLSIKLYPIGGVTRGYRSISGPTDIEDNQVYGFGDYEFLFISDPNII
jgi:uncharacterized protein YegL